MVNYHSKSFTVEYLLFGRLVCLGGGIAKTRYKKATECFNDRPPLSSFVLTIERGQQKFLIQQSQKSADQHGFKKDISHFMPQSDQGITKDRYTVIPRTAIFLRRGDTYLLHLLLLKCLLTCFSRLNFSG
jgi:hypothetical protein